MTKWNTKCRFFNENYACDTLTSESYKSCEECKFSSLYSKKILIIKLGALGDVLRTTPLAEAIKKKYPDCLIYWLTEESSAELLENNPYIDKILTYNLDNILRLQQEKFNILFSLEIDTPTTLLANLIKADEKFGFYFDNGSTSCFNESAEEYLETAFLTHLKLKNRKTYQEMIFQACCLPYNKEEIFLELTDTEKKYAEKFKQEKNIKENDKLFGINFSSSSRWPSKAWAKEKIIELIEKMQDNYKIIILGGPEEHEKMPQLIEELKNKGINVLANNPKNTIKEFSSIINLCEKIIVTDSLSLHLATALKKPIIALFFSTPPWEIEDYEIVKKLNSPLLEKYFFTNYYSDELANSILVEEVIQALENQ